MTDKNKVTLYDPHPGFGGAIVPLPEGLKRLVDELNGKQLSLEETIAILKPESDKLNGRLEVFAECILFLYRDSSSFKHCYRLLKYKKG